VDQIAAKIKAAPKNSKILLDLRDTPGDAAQGIRLANFFIKDGTLATLQGQQFATQTFTADPAQFLTAAPVAVVVNRGTYGGPELAAAAIEDRKRGDVVGERTFGEGSFQKSIELPDGADLLLTVAKYQSPSGVKIQDAAVTPNVVVEAPQDEEDVVAPSPKGDEMLNKALDLLKGKAA
jgi:carboxyl-terminal processing protease